MGLVSPVDFIPVAEVNGAIVPLTKWIIRAVCNDLAEWKSSGKLVNAAVNISSAHFDKLDLVTLVQQVVSDTGINPCNLEIEITESVLEENIDRIRDCCEKLAEMGTGIALDDFGSGFMRYSYLQELPVKKLKIDGAFVQKIEDDKTCAAIVDSLVTAGRSLGITIVAEGIENGNQARILKDLGCQIGQGYYFSRPLPRNEITTWMSENTAAGIARLIS